MTCNNDPNVLTEIIERATDQNPHAKELLRVFGPLIAAQRKLSASIQLTDSDLSSIDPAKLSAGVPVSRQVNLYSPDDPVGSVALSLAETASRAIPSSEADFVRLHSFLQEQSFPSEDWIWNEVDHRESIINRWIEDNNLIRDAAMFLASLIARVVRECRRREIMSSLDSINWTKGYCPVCGDFPSIALIEEQGGKRFLHCSSCGHDWYFTRVTCPYCGNEAQRGMEYFYIENKTQDAAFVCGECKKYLVTLFRAGDLFARDMDISAISMTHMDFIMQEKGYDPMTHCLWNAIK